MQAKAPVDRLSGGEGRLLKPMASAHGDRIPSEGRIFSQLTMPSATSESDKEVAERKLAVPQVFEEWELHSFDGVVLGVSRQPSERVVKAFKRLLEQEERRCTWRSTAKPTFERHEYRQGKQ